VSKNELSRRQKRNVEIAGEGNRPLPQENRAGLDTPPNTAYNLDRLDRRLLMARMWQIQEAKNKFSEVVAEALKNGPQVITKRGVETVIVLSYDEYRREMLNKKKLSDFFRESPLAKTDIDLRRDKSGPRTDVSL
jgi:antitoxin Phd